MHVLSCKSNYALGGIATSSFDVASLPTLLLQERSSHPLPRRSRNAQLNCPMNFDALIILFILRSLCPLFDTTRRFNFVNHAVGLTISIVSANHSPSEGTPSNNSSPNNTFQIPYVEAIDRTARIEAFNQHIHVQNVCEFYIFTFDMQIPLIFVYYAAKSLVHRYVMSLSLNLLSLDG